MELPIPLLVKIFKPRSRLIAGDKYKTKPELAVEIIQELKALFPFRGLFCSQQVFATQPM